MSRRSTAMFERSPETADAIADILGLPPELQWGEVHVQFGTEDFGTATVTFFPTGEQIVELAKLAVLPLPGNDCVAPDVDLNPGDLGA